MAARRQIMKYIQNIHYFSNMDWKPFLRPIAVRYGIAKNILSTVQPLNVNKARTILIFSYQNLIPCVPLSVNNVARFMHITHRKFPGQVTHFVHQELEEFELPPLRYRPEEGIDALSEATKFTREELQFIYRGFKQECPSGVISEETFKTIYGKFFPLTDSAMYAHYVFGTMDQDGTGTITFGDFIMGLSTLLKGSLAERITWIFNLYDINNDGYITKEELIDIVTSIYDLLGDSTIPAIDDSTAEEHVDKIFERLDLNKDGVVTMDEFMEYCTKNDHVIQSMNLFGRL
ncbi:unnamed protein product, partial [Meganyctiphanes norvegica]